MVSINQLYFSCINIYTKIHKTYWKYKQSISILYGISEIL